MYTRFDWAVIISRLARLESELQIKRVLQRASFPGITTIMLCVLMMLLWSSKKRPRHEAATCKYHVFVNPFCANRYQEMLDRRIPAVALRRVARSEECFERKSQLRPVDGSVVRSARISWIHRNLPATCQAGLIAAMPAMPLDPARPCVLANCLPNLHSDKRV